MPNRQSFGPGRALDWLVCAAAGGLLVCFVGRPVLLAADAETCEVTSAGSWAPFLRVGIIFAAKYALAVTMAARPELRETLSWADAAASGFSAGYFLVWGVTLFSGFRARTSAAASRHAA